MPNNQEIRRIDDSRQMKDINGNLVGRQFYVIRRTDKDIQYGTWQPFQQVFTNKKALRSYYNKHPQLPYPNILADNDDQDFNPSQIPKKNPNKSKPQADSQSKPKGRPSKDSYKLNDPKQQKMKHLRKGVRTDLQQKKNTLAQVKGLYTLGNQIMYHVVQNGAHSYKSRKWVLQNCKLSLIQFYEKCMVLKPK